MLSRVLRTIRRHDLFGGAPANRVLCAVSGGPDSMALLACLWELAPRLGLTIEVATVDHGLRAEAAGEMALVADRAAALGLPWHPVRVDVPAARAEGPVRGGGVQETARRLRLDALAALAEARGLGRVALGHQADDQTETILFRVLRGTGRAGLQGMPVRRDPFVRPLLDVTRAEVLAYLGRRSLPFADDPSNRDMRYARARLRHQILPLLRRENPRVDEALRSLSEAAAPPAELAGVHVPRRLGERIADAVRDGRGTRTFDVTGRRRVTVSYGRARLDPGSGAPALDPGATPSRAAPEVAVRGARPEVRIPGTGVYSLGDHQMLVVRAGDGAGPDGSANGAGCDLGASVWAWFDGDQVPWPLSVRPRRPGERMRPRGGIGTRKLSDLMIDARIPKHARASLPVVATVDGEPLFVPGLRPSQVAAPSIETRRWVGMALRPVSGHDGLIDPSIIEGNTQSHRFLKQTYEEVDDDAK